MAGFNPIIYGRFWVITEGWAQEAYRMSERHAAGLVQLANSTLRYQSRKVFDEVLCRRLRELAGTHVRYGYRRLTVLLR